MNHDTNVTLADLAARKPGAAQVFLLHGLDFCCKGRRPVSVACAEKGLDPEAILAAVDEAASLGTALTDWTERPVDDLVRHIVEHYHARLREQMPALVAMAERVEVRHADKPSVPRGLAAHLARMQEAAFAHLEKEESGVFPQILHGAAADCGGIVHALEHEHEEHGAALPRTRSLAGGLVPPPEACTTWRALYLGLVQLERELMEHIHLENNVLFPRVLCR